MSLKDMGSGVQERLSPAEAARRIQSALAGARTCPVIREG